MIVPQYWAESRAQHRERGRQITVRRYGWSDESQDDAQQMADDRAAEALERLKAGEKLHRREHKVGYNGGQGLPIREEIVERHGDAVVTRNAYGARCLNTPNVLFVDLDEEPSFSGFVNGCLGCVTPIATIVFFLLILRETNSIWIAGASAVGLSILIAWLVTMAFRVREYFREPWESRARKRIEGFLEHRPEWNLRLYRTPNGMRLLATHQVYSPDDPEVRECFEALGADPVYQRMCFNQKCFRARLTAKPWRLMWDGDHIPPRNGVWPVREEVMPLRRAWIAEYEQVASRYAACRFLESIGSGAMHHQVRWVQELHDEMCGATSGRELA